MSDQYNVTLHRDDCSSGANSIKVMIHHQVYAVCLSVASGRCHQAKHPGTQKCTETALLILQKESVTAALLSQSHAKPVHMLTHTHTQHQSYPGMTAPVISLWCPAAAYTTVFNCVKATLRTNGIRGPFQGLGPTLVRNAPANSVYLGSFEVMKGKMAEHKGCKKTELPAPWVITAGGLGGILYWCAIYPVDVIKSAMATDSIIPKERKYPDMATTYKVCTHQKIMTACHIQLANWSLACKVQLGSLLLPK